MVSSIYDARRPIVLRTCNWTILANSLASILLLLLSPRTTAMPPLRCISPGVPVTGSVGARFSRLVDLLSTGSLRDSLLACHDLCWTGSFRGGMLLPGHLCNCDQRFLLPGLLFHGALLFLVPPRCCCSSTASPVSSLCWLRCRLVPLGRPFRWIAAMSSALNSVWNLELLVTATFASCSSGKLPTALPHGLQTNQLSSFLCLTLTFV